MFLASEGPGKLIQMWHLFEGGHQLENKQYVASSITQNIKRLYYNSGYVADVIIICVCCFNLSHLVLGYP